MKYEVIKYRAYKVEIETSSPEDVKRIAEEEIWRYPGKCRLKSDDRFDIKIIDNESVVERAEGFNQLVKLIEDARDTMLQNH